MKKVFGNIEMQERTSKNGKGYTVPVFVDETGSELPLFVSFEQKPRIELYIERYGEEVDEN